MIIKTAETVAHFMGGIFIFFSGSLASLMTFFPLRQDASWIDLGTGPAGGLVILIVAIVSLWKYFQRITKEKNLEAEKYRDKLIENLEKERDYWRERANTN